MHAMIFDNSCTSSSNFQVPISGVTGTQMGGDVILQEVRFIINHSWDNDLDLWLYAPSGIGVELSTDNGGGADNYGDPSDLTCSNYTALTMNACISVVDGKAPFIGSFLPEGNFADFNDGSNPNGTWIFQACDDAGGDVGFVEYIELVFGEMSCSPPQNLMQDTISDSFTNITWETSATCTNTLLEYGPAGFIPGTDNNAGGGTLVVVPCPAFQPFPIGGLSQLTDYDIYIRELCPNGGYSQNSCPLNITTSCTTDLLTLKERFDAQPTCSTSCGTACPVSGVWTNVGTDDFDWIIDEGGTGSANTGPEDDVTTGGNYLYLETSGTLCRNGNEAVLQSQCMEIKAASGSCHLSFYYHMYGTNVNELALEISIDGGVNWQPLWSLQGEQGNQWWRQYIDLSAYHNQVALFRFVGKGGSGIRGDIGLDEIEFFGTEVFTGSSIVYYADTDMDGYGNPDDSIFFCSAIQPVGFVTNANDCDDTNAAVSPLGTEIPCNGTDENCDGFFQDTIAAPILSDTSVCAGTDLMLSINTSATGSYYWLDTNGNLLANGQNYQTGVLNDSVTYFVIDSITSQCSSPATPITINVEPNPDIFTIDQPSICVTETFDLNSINITDVNNTGGTISFHSATPTSFSNLLNNTLVSPATTTTYYIRSTTALGCFGETNIELTINPLPTAAINPNVAQIDICGDDLLNISATETGTGTPPMTYEWDNGSFNQQRLITASNMPGVNQYSITVTDASGCTDEENIAINTLVSVTSVSIDNVSDVSFCGGNDGSITLNPLNGDPPYSYQWSGPVSGNAGNINGAFTLNNLSQGAYQITITDDASLACDIVIPVVIINGPGAIIDSVINVIPVTCNGAANGSIDITVNGNTPGFIWSNGATTEDLNGVVAGTYSVTVMDGFCNTVLTNIVIPEPENLSLSVNGFGDANCYGAADGWINVDVNGGVAPYDFNWSHGPQTEDVNNLPTGFYSLLVTDVNGCVTNLTNFEIDEPSDFVLTLDTIQQVDCNGGTQGQIEINTQGATAPYTYQWNNGDATEDSYFLGAGTYMATITDAHGCTTLTNQYQVTEPAELDALITNLVPPTCNQIFDGSLTVTAFGGTAPYTYEWSNGAVTSTIIDLAPGAYQATITDAKACTKAIELVDLMAPTLMFIDIAQFENESCHGLEDGSIGIEVAGGSTPYTYAWNNGATTQDLSNLPGGEYIVTITDVNGCDIVSSTLEVISFSPLSSSLDAHFNVSCFGQNDGSIYISTPPNEGPYTFDWSNGETSQNITQLSPGDYAATITSTSGCIFYTDSFEISEPPLLDLEVVSTESPSCNGFFNGNIDVNLTGGSSPYVYSWNNGGNTEDLNNIPAGSYNLAVIDNNGCVVSSSNINLTEPQELDITVAAVNDVGCIDSIGVIDLEVSGGVGPYTYLWETGDSLPDIYNIPAGFYNVSITDQNNCQALLSSIEVQQLADTIQIVNTAVHQISCFGTEDGSIDIEVIGGNYPFQYTWSNGFQDSLNTSLSGNTYNVTVTDNYGCVGVTPWVTIDNPDLLSYQVTQILNNNCSGDMQGLINVVANGGVEPYTFEWNNGADTSYLDGLAGGSYVLTITDASGCSVVTNPPINLSDAGTSVQTQLIDMDHIPCFGMTEGSITINASGGVGGYMFNWNTGETEPSIENLFAGFYQCTVTDANGCSTITPGYILTQPDAPLEVDSFSVQVSDVTTCTGEDGFINITTIGGTGPYSFFWSEGSLVEDIYDLSAGVYECAIIDAQGCSANSEIFEIFEPVNTLEADVYFSTPDTNNLSNGTAAVIINGGVWPFEFDWDASANFQSDSVAINLGTGVYELTITDAIDCTTITNVFVDTVTVMTTAISDFSNFSFIEYFPNPTSGSLLVKMALHTSANVEVSVHALLGKTLLKKSSLSPSDQFEFDFDLAAYPSGIYFLEIVVDGELTSSRKVVLAR